MIRFVFLVFIVYLILIGFFGYFNNNTVTVVIYKDLTRDVPLWTVALFSSLIGAALLFVIYTVRDTKRLFKKLQEQKRQKRTEKLHRLYSQALAAIHAGKDDEAEATLQEVLRTDSNYIAALVMMGEIQMRKGDHGRAEEYFREVLEKQPNNRDALFNLAEVKHATGEHEEALRYIERVLKTDRRDIKALYKKRQILEELQRWQELLELQQEICDLKDDPSEQENLKGYMYEAGMQALHSGDTDSAKRYFKDILKEDRDFIPAHLGYTEVLIKQGKDREAEEYLIQAFEETGSLVLLARIEDLLLQKEDPSRLIKIYRKAISSRPTDSALKFFLAKLYYRLQMLDDALQSLEEIEDPNKIPDITRLTGAIYLQQGRYEKAAEALTKALDLKNTIKIPYCCSNCGWTQKQWSGRCPNCGRWNSFSFNIYESCERTVGQ